MVRNHREGKASRSEAEEAMESVGLDPARLDSYPHELSGGMKQRVMIAFAFELSPSIVIADEPTTALDVITQDEILQKIEYFSKSYEASVIIITHDLAVVAETCDKVGVMYAGDLVEYGPVSEIFHQPAHPYTMGLVNAAPDISKIDSELVSIPGLPPRLTDATTGCKFFDRCPFGITDCQESIDNEFVGSDHWAKCVRTDEYERLYEQSKMRNTWSAEASDD
jgi:oligopeptide/dipeptide ABC transporter ATP-binding protein